jgi:hypothetical protein
MNNKFILLTILQQKMYGEWYLNSYMDIILLLYLYDTQSLRTDPDHKYLVYFICQFKRKNTHFVFHKFFNKDYLSLNNSRHFVLVSY